ncbi:hypothetical protein LguiB_031808 [Lonicera macranthoides]
MGCSRASARSEDAQRHAVTARAANHDRGNGILASISIAGALATAPILTGQCPESIGKPAFAIPHPTGGITGPHPLPSR